MRRDGFRFIRSANQVSSPGFFDICNSLLMSSLQKGGSYLFYPDFGKVKVLAQKFNIIPVSMEVYADMETPISVFKRIEAEDHCFLLESVEGGEKWARY